MLDDESIQSYLAPLESNQQEAIRGLRQLVFQYNPTLKEEIDQGKWFGGMLVYATKEGQFLYALGPRVQGYTTFHMMPYYGSKELQAKYGEQLKKFLSGKSCIKFKKFQDLPLVAIEGILQVGTSEVLKFMAELKAKKR